MNGLPTGSRRLVTVLLNRVGDSVTIERPDGNATANKYGKVSDTDVSYNTVGTDLGYRVYESEDSRPNEASAVGGRIDTDDPIIALPHDTAAQEDDRVTFDSDSETYVLDELIDAQTHNEFRSTLVT